MDAFPPDGRSLNLDQYQPREPVERCGKNRDVVIKAVVTGLVPEIILQEHASALTELDDGTLPAFPTGRPMVSGSQPDLIECLGPADSMLGGGARVLAGQHVAFEIDGEILGAIHPAFLAERVGRLPARNRPEEPFDLCAERGNRHCLSGDQLAEHADAIGELLVSRERR